MPSVSPISRAVLLLDHEQLSNFAHATANAGDRRRHLFVLTCGERTRINGDQAFNALAPARSTTELNGAQRTARSAMRVFHFFEHLVGALRMLERFIALGEM